MLNIESYYNYITDKGFRTLLSAATISTLYKHKNNFYYEIINYIQYIFAKWKEISVKNWSIRKDF